MDSILIGSELGMQKGVEWPRKSHCEAHCTIGRSPPPHFMWKLWWTSQVWPSTKGKIGKSTKKKVMRSVWFPNGMCIETGSHTLEMIPKPNRRSSRAVTVKDWVRRSVGMQCFWTHCSSMKQSTALESTKASTRCCRWNHDSVTGIKVRYLVE